MSAGFIPCFSIFSLVYLCDRYPIRSESAMKKVAMVIL